VKAELKVRETLDQKGGWAGGRSCRDDEERRVVGRGKQRWYLLWLPVAALHICIACLS
jgi:hypothetical protein